MQFDCPCSQTAFALPLLSFFLVSFRKIDTSKHVLFFFFHLQPIEPHTELKVWYAADYAKFMEASAVFIKEESDVSPLPSVAVSTPTMH